MKFDSYFTAVKYTSIYFDVQKIKILKLQLVVILAFTMVLQSLDGELVSVRDLD